MDDSTKVGILLIVSILIISMFSIHKYHESLKRYVENNYVACVYHGSSNWAWLPKDVCLKTNGFGSPETN